MPNTPLIWTNHAKQRLQERRLSQDLATQAFRYPDRQEPGKQPGSTKFISRFDESTVTVLAAKNDQGEWIAISAWVDPPYRGTKDWHKKRWYRVYQQAGFWKRLGMQCLRQIGLIEW